MAYEARLNPAEVAADASLFDDETLPTEPEGMVGIRAGQARVSLGGSTVASLHPLADGKSRGRSPASKGRAKQAEIKTLGPKVLQVSPRRGALEFSYGNEQRVLPEGQTYRIHLDAPEDSGSGALNESPGIS